MMSRNLFLRHVAKTMMPQKQLQTNNVALLRLGAAVGALASPAQRTAAKVREERPRDALSPPAAPASPAPLARQLRAVRRRARRLRMRERRKAAKQAEARKLKPGS